MPAKIVFIVNPYSGKGRGRESIPLIKKYCKANNIISDIISTEYPRHATELAENYNNAEILISAGGDEALNEIINALNDYAPVQIGVLPIGSGNDFSRNLNLVKGIGNNLLSIF
ncbi:MAG: hypothetical protein CR986_05800 [Ignavibacteriae bacterium]|nr:MAG: hypothetical protein CR986_05800 [Ignavibacteriota bacterium]